MPLYQKRAGVAAAQRRCYRELTQGGAIGDAGRKKSLCLRSRHAGRHRRGPDGHARSHHGRGLRHDPLGDARALSARRPRAIQRALRQQGAEVDAERKTRCSEIFLAHYETRIADASTLYPGVEAALDQLERTGAAFAVCTNKIERPAKLLLEKLGVLGRFAFVCGQDTFGVAKPDPTPLLRTIQASGVFPRARSWWATEIPTSPPPGLRACR